MASNIGLNIVEVDGASSPAIAGAATSVGAFHVITQRGVPNRPIRVDSFPAFVERFGGFFAGGLGAYLVKGFFDNGGQTAYINRVAASDGAAPSLLTLKDGAGTDTLTLRAGFRGDADPGTWGNALWVKVNATTTPQVRLSETAAAAITGATITDAVNMSSLPSLTVRIDGESAPTVIAFQTSDFPTPTTATRAQIRDAINRRTTKLIASIATDKLVLTSTGAVARLNKDWTSLQVTTANATLGFSNTSLVSGTPAAPTATSATLDRVDEFRVGDAVRVVDASAHSAFTKITAVNPLARTVSFSPGISGIGDFNTLQLRIRRAEFDVTVASGGTDTGNVVETWTGLSMESDAAGYAPRMFNDKLRGSRYLTASDANSTSAVGADVPADTSGFARLDTGRDGTPTANDFIGDAAQRTGFSAFDAFDITLLASERTDPAIVNAALAYCANRGDCMLIGAVPEDAVENGSALAYGQAFQARKVFGALYGPWIVVQDPAGSGAAPLKTISPVGHVMGVYARIETTRGVWKAPAGDEASLLGVLDVEHRLSDGEHTNLVVNGSVNGIRAVPRAGIIIDASRTLSTDTRWRYVNVRLLFNFVKASLKTGLRWVRQEPNKDTLWKSIKFTSVTPFLTGLWRQGAFGTGDPADVFTVICDATNNPPDEVDKGNLKVEVYFYPAKPAETIVIIVGQQPSGAQVSEA